MHLGNASGFDATGNGAMQVRILEPRMGFEEVHAIAVTNFVYSCIAAGGLVLVGCGDGALHVIDIEVLISLKLLFLSADRAVSILLAALFHAEKLWC